MTVHAPTTSGEKMGEGGGEGGMPLGVIQLHYGRATQREQTSTPRHPPPPPLTSRFPLSHGPTLSNPSTQHNSHPTTTHPYSRIHPT